MGLNDTASSDRVHIAFFGKRNAGKSSVANAVTGQNISVVSDVKGTTTDPVRKTMELLPLGPVVITDTPGFDDDGILGGKRVSAANRILDETDIAVLVVDGTKGKDSMDEKYIRLFDERKIPYITVYNKSDISDAVYPDGISVSAVTGEGIEKLKNRLAGFAVPEERYIVRDFINRGDTVVMVTPIDESAPKGRIILPQQQTLREILDAGGMAFVTQHTEYGSVLENLKNRPRLVITDSQVFGYVESRTPEDVNLTSFSMLLANKKGFLQPAVKGVSVLDSLREGDRILVSEACTHHRQCRDIGTVKIPAMIKKYTGKDFVYDVSSGGEFPEDLSRYSLIIHCGACMINDRAMMSRLRRAENENVPFTNYGTCIAYMQGILKRACGIFPDIEKILK